MCCRGLTPLASPGQWGFMPTDPLPSLPEIEFSWTVFSPETRTCDCGEKHKFHERSEAATNSYYVNRYSDECFVSHDSFHQYRNQCEALVASLHERIRNLESALSTTEEERDLWADDCTTLARSLYGAIHCPHIVPGPGLWYANVQDLIDETPIQTTSRGEWFIPASHFTPCESLLLSSLPSSSSHAPSSSATPDPSDA